MPKIVSNTSPIISLLKLDLLGLLKKVSADFSGCKHISDCGLLNCSGIEIWEYAKLNSYVD